VIYRKLIRVSFNYNSQVFASVVDHMESSLGLWTL